MQYFSPKKTCEEKQNITSKIKQLRYAPSLISYKKVLSLVINVGNELGANGLSIHILMAVLRLFLR